MRGRRERGVRPSGAPRGREEALRPRGGAFLGGAKSRLLPASIPFRYFAAAVAYHVLAWLALLGGADDVPTFAGGLGWPLAALHLVTLGVLVMTAVGASLQLLPVATRQPLRWPRAPALIWWLYTPGVAAIALGMGMPAPAWLAGGALLVVLALAGYAALLAWNLIGARGMPAVAFHGWVALASLAIVVATALSLACAYVGVPGLARDTALALHVAFAGYGFMGMLALGLSYIVVPMFALSAAPDSRMARASCGLAVVALVLAGAAALGVAPRVLRVVAIAAGSVAVGLHLKLMTAALRTGMRRELGRSFALVRTSWGAPRCKPGRWPGRHAGRSGRRRRHIVRPDADRRLAPDLPARHPAAHRPFPGVDARGGAGAARTHTLVAHRGAAAGDSFLVSSGGTGIARAGCRRAEHGLHCGGRFVRRGRQRGFRGVLRDRAAALAVGNRYGRPAPAPGGLTRINCRRCARC